MGAFSDARKPAERGALPAAELEEEIGVVGEERKRIEQALPAPPILERAHVERDQRILGDAEPRTLLGTGEAGRPAGRRVRQLQEGVRVR